MAQFVTPRLTIEPGETVVFEASEPSQGRVAREIAAGAIIPWAAPRTEQSGHALTVPVAVGVALAEPGQYPTSPPGEAGGNMDIRQLTAGATLYLPVQVQGALFSVGDAHAAQGDGEVAGTRIETDATVTLRFDLQKGRRIPGPQLLAPTAGPSTGPWFAATGHDPDLRVACREALRSVVADLGDQHGLDQPRALVLASACVDLRISQIVNAGVFTVSALLPLSIFGA